MPAISFSNWSHVSIAVSGRPFRVLYQIAASGFRLDPGFFGWEIRRVEASSFWGLNVGTYFLVRRLGIGLGEFEPPAAIGPYPCYRN